MTITHVDDRLPTGVRGTHEIWFMGHEDVPRGARYIGTRVCTALNNEGVKTVFRGFECDFEGSQMLQLVDGELVPFQRRNLVEGHRSYDGFGPPLWDAVRQKAGADPYGVA